jgi:hypothetical protein
MKSLKWQGLKDATKKQSSHNFNQLKQDAHNKKLHPTTARLTDGPWVSSST